MSKDTISSLVIWAAFLLNTVNAINGIAEMENNLMSRILEVTFNNNEVAYALNAQANGIYPYGFPFTLNLTMGCFFGCKYCYSPITLRKVIENKRDSFFSEVTVRNGIPDALKKDLERYSSLPQHLKRVQICEHSEYYLPQLFSEIKSQNQPDIMLEVLNIFQEQWNKGNKWMVHILSKSHLILNHLATLKAMKEMIQVEISFSTQDEKILRQVELYSPSILKRLETIEALAKAGIFVRVMAMPFYGDRNDLTVLKQMNFAKGAVALKNKGLNYYDWQAVQQISEADLLNGKLLQTGSRKDSPIDVSLNINSGEPYLVSGQKQLTTVKMPKEKDWQRMSKFDDRVKDQQLEIINCGYALCNSVNWEYIK
jgi:DNA repair photolyase